MKSEGTFFPQVLIRTLNAIGMLRLMPRMFAFNAVQRQIAASRSKSPPSTEQHGWSGGFPTTVPILPLSSCTHTPSFRASLGQLPLKGIGFGLGFGIGGVLHPLARTKNIRLKNRKRATEDGFLESIEQKIGL